MTSSIERVTSGSLATLWAEGPTAPMHMALAAELSPEAFGCADGTFDLHYARRVIASRLPRAPRLLQTLHPARRFAGGPYWADDPRFNVTEHVGFVELSPHTSEQEFLSYCANEAVLPLDREKPLWRMRFLRGWDGGRLALLIIVHHAVADGVTGLAMFASLLDDAPSGDVPMPPAPSERAPGWFQLAKDAWQRRRAHAVHLLHSLDGLPEHGRHLARAWKTGLSYLRAEATPTSWLRHVGPGRRVALISTDFERTRAAAHREGVTINDLMLEAFRAGVAQVLRFRGELKEAFAFNVSIPMMLSNAGPNPGGMMVVPVPVNETDAARALHTIAKETKKHRDQRAAGEAPAMMLMPRFAGPLFVRWLKHAGRHKVNAYLTNVGGSRIPMWLGPAQVERAFPFGPLVAGVALSVAVMSWDDELNVVIHVDDEFDDLELLRDEMAKRLEELLGAAPEVLPEAEFESGAAAP